MAALLTGIPLFEASIFGELNRIYDSLPPLIATNDPALILIFTSSFGRQLHRIASLLLLSAIVIHVANRTVRRRPTEIPLTPKDQRDLIGAVMHWMGRRKSYPEMGFHHPAEKMVYWGAGVAGLLMNGVAGLILWFPWLVPPIFHSYALLVKDAGFLLMSVLLVGHVAFALNPTNWPVLKAMLVKGNVAGHWARSHHLGWYRRIRAERETSPEQQHVLKKNT